MKRILCVLMIVVMLTPGLVCGPFMGAGKAHAAGMQMGHCHEAAMHEHAGKGSLMNNGAVKGTMMFKDCARVDLSGVDHAAAKAPDLKVTKVFYSDPAIFHDYGFVPLDSHQIRGPPPLETAEGTTAYPPVYLTTQRIRI